MIGNSFLGSLYLKGNVNFCMNEIGEMYKYNRNVYLERLSECDLEFINEEERKWLTVISTYMLTLQLTLNDDKNNVPEWTLSEVLLLKTPLVIGYRKEDPMWLKLVLCSSSVMSWKNVYIDLNGFIRV